MHFKKSRNSVLSIMFWKNMDIKNLESFITFLTDHSNAFYFIIPILLIFTKLAYLCFCITNMRLEKRNRNRKVYFICLKKSVFDNLAFHLCSKMMLMGNKNNYFSTMADQQELYYYFVFYNSTKTLNPYLNIGAVV